MSDELLPAKVRLTDGLGPLPEDALRQQAFVILSRLQSGTEDVVRLDTALAAVKEERKRLHALTNEQVAALTIMLDHYKGDPRTACLLPLVCGA